MSACWEETIYCCWRDDTNRSWCGFWVAVVKSWAGGFTSLRLEKTHQVGRFFGFFGTSRCFPSASLQDPAEETERERKCQRSASSSRPRWRQKPEISSALRLWLPWMHISVRCRRRCHRNCFHFILMLCYAQESINKMQVGGTWLCLRTGNSSFSCSKITVALSVCALFGLLSEVCLLWILLWLNVPQTIRADQKYSGDSGCVGT